MMLELSRTGFVRRAGRSVSLRHPRSSVSPLRTALFRSGKAPNGVSQPPRPGVTRSWQDGRHGDVLEWRSRVMRQLRVGGRDVPLALTISVLCWLLPGPWTGLGSLIPTLFMPAEIRDSGWFGSGTLAVLATYTVIVMGVPVLMLCRSRMARAALTVVAATCTAAVISAPALAPLTAYIPVMAGAVLMWLPQSNRYLQTPIHHGNGAVL